MSRRGAAPGPDALSALVVAHDVLVHSTGQWSLAAPVGVAVGDGQPVTSMAAYLARRTDGRGTGYDPLATYRPARRSR